MLQTFTKVIGAHTYTVTQLDAVKGRKVLARIVRNIGPAIAKAQSVANEGEAAQGAAFIGEVVGALTDENIDFFATRSRR
jgi:hypothetical protein